MNIKESLSMVDPSQTQCMFHDIEVDPKSIKAILINEIVPLVSTDDFYGSPDADYLSTTLALFNNAGIHVSSAKELLDRGIYLTNAVKTPKFSYTVERSMIEESLPYLEKELSLFPNVQVIMLMGDVAKKAMNMISKKNTNKNVIPSISTYKLRSSQFYYHDIRIIPSYIMTGKNILIEKSKFQMASEDIFVMFDLISE